jgi:murein DD-endopeptidase MepM/ murein hydrolase activator NlpD
LYGPRPQSESERSFLKKRFYIILVSREEDGTLRKASVPMHYAYGFVAAAIIGIFTITGLAGSYSRMLIKTARFNQLRNDQNSLRNDYAHLEKQAHEKDVQAASLGSLATEVSALYGLTASKLAGPVGHIKLPSVQAKSKGEAPVIADASAGFSDESYYKSLDTFYSLRDSAMSGTATQVIGKAAGLGTIPGFNDMDLAIGAPSLWPVVGPIRSSFGEREDPVNGNGEGEFHTGIDISAPMGTPIRATADGTVKMAEMTSGYGREVIIDHGHDIETCYAHMAGFTVLAGQNVVRGQVIGYVGMSGRTTGAHLHYEVRVHNTPVNPHKYLVNTMSGDDTVAAGL